MQVYMDKVDNGLKCNQGYFRLVFFIHSGVFKGYCCLISSMIHPYRIRRNRTCKGRHCEHQHQQRFQNRYIYPAFHFITCKSRDIRLKFNALTDKICYPFPEQPTAGIFFKNPVKISKPYPFAAVK